MCIQMTTQLGDDITTFYRVFILFLRRQLPLFLNLIVNQMA